VAESTDKPLLIKRYASRRLYNTETSDYVTLEDIASFIREGRDVQIVDLKSGDDLTRGPAAQPDPDDIKFDASPPEIEGLELPPLDAAPGTPTDGPPLGPS